MLFFLMKCTVVEVELIVESLMKSSMLLCTEILLLRLN